MPDEQNVQSSEVDVAESPGRGSATWLRYLVGGLIGILAFVITTQVTQGSEAEDFTGVRGAELGELLKSLDTANEGLSRQISELTQTRDSLRDSSVNTEQAEEAARNRADQLAILAGTVPAQGPGVQLTIDAPDGGISAALLLDTVEELRGAGAEVVVINGTVRVVAQTYFLDTHDGIQVAGQLLSPPYVIEAIGDPGTMAEAANFRGGVVDRVRTWGGTTVIEERELIEVTALAETPESQYARPAS